MLMDTCKSVYMISLRSSGLLPMETFDGYYLLYLLIPSSVVEGRMCSRVYNLFSLYLNHKAITFLTKGCLLRALTNIVSLCSVIPLFSIATKCTNHGI